MDLDELRRISAKEELSLNFIAKDEMISNALAGLQGFDCIILKGGTAINRVYLKNKRFSEDIDFDLVFDNGVKEAVPKTKEIISKLTRFVIGAPRLMKNTIRYDLFYANPLNHKDRIMLEFKIVKEAFNYSKKIVNFGFVPAEPALLNVYDAEELMLQKVECIMSRVEGKDFFDLYYLMDVPGIQATKIRENKDKLIAMLNPEEKQIKIIANSINHYIPRDKRPRWNIFLEELKKKINQY